MYGMNENKLNHVGVIMDGNRRWARKNGLKSVLMGHEKGVRKLMELCTWCLDKSIPYLSVYAFSTENWNRSQVEIEGLFAIMEKFFREEVGDCVEKGIRIKVVGNLQKLGEKQRKLITDAQKQTEGCKNLQVQIAISYGGRDEITRAFQKIAKKVEKGEVSPVGIDEKMIERSLDTAGAPLIDMVIRTGGNHRLSNFFTWQTAYFEIYFTDTLWPDFTKEEFHKYVEDYERVSINMGR